MRRSSQYLKTIASTLCCTSVRSSTLPRRTGPNEETVARTCVPRFPVRLKNSTGNASGVCVRPTDAARAVSRSLASPGRHMPARSPFTSARNTGTPARESPSASSCSVRVFPVPVEPAIMPWRFIIRSGMRIGSSRGRLAVAQHVADVDGGRVESVGGCVGLVEGHAHSVSRTRNVVICPTCVRSLRRWVRKSHPLRKGNGARICRSTFNHPHSSEATHVSCRACIGESCVFSRAFVRYITSSHVADVRRLAIRAPAGVDRIRSCHGGRPDTVGRCGPFRRSAAHGRRTHPGARRARGCTGGRGLCRSHEGTVTV